MQLQRQKKRYIYRESERQTDRQVGRHTDRYINWYVGREFVYIECYRTSLSLYLSHLKIHPSCPAVSHSPCTNHFSSQEGNPPFRLPQGGPIPRPRRGDLFHHSVTSCRHSVRINETTKPSRSMGPSCASITQSVALMPGGHVHFQMCSVMNSV